LWNNKIVGHAHIDPESLLAHPGNFRIHPSNQQKALEGSIGKLGFIRSVTVSQRTGTVIDGHLRVILALRNQEPTIPVEYVDLTPEEENEALLLLDPISSLANTDREKMEELLVSVSANDDSLNDLLDIIAKNENVEYKEKEERDAEPQISRADELLEKWKVEPGDLWQIGNHRLLCGDSTILADVEMVMGGEKAKLFETDPPYGVNYSELRTSQSAMRRTTVEYDDISSDTMDGPELKIFLEACFSAWLPRLDSNCAWYLWHAQLTQGFFAAAAAAAAV